MADQDPDVCFSLGRDTYRVRLSMHKEVGLAVVPLHYVTSSGSSFEARFVWVF